MVESQQNDDALEISVGGTDSNLVYETPNKKTPKRTDTSFTSGGSGGTKYALMIMMISGCRLPTNDKKQIWIEWSRGAKSAETAKKTLRPATNEIRYKERFQIKAKMKHDGTGFHEEFHCDLKVMTDAKHGGMLASTILDLAVFDDVEESKYSMMKLQLKNDSDELIEDSWIEVGLKAQSKDAANLSTSMSKSKLASPSNSSFQSKGALSNASSFIATPTNSLSLVALSSEEQEALAKKRVDLKTQIEKQQKKNAKLKKQNPTELEKKQTDLSNMESDLKMLERSIATIDVGAELKFTTQQQRQELEQMHANTDNELSENQEDVKAKQEKLKNAFKMLNDRISAKQEQMKEQARVQEEYNVKLENQKNQIKGFFGSSRFQRPEQ